MAALLAVVTTALTVAGLVVYVVERDRVEDQVTANVDQEFAELDKLVQGTNPRTQKPFAGASEVIDTFFLRNVAGSSEVLVGWWQGGAKRQTPNLPGLDLDLGPTSELTRSLTPLVEAGRSGRLDLPALGEVVVSVQPVSKGGEQASLVVLTFMDRANEGLRDTMRTYTFASLGALVVIGVGAGWLAGRLLAPLRDLRRTADAITARDLDQRLPESGNDDITALTRTINGMLDRLSGSFAAQRQFLDDAGHELKTPLTVLGGHLELLDPHEPAEVESTRVLLLDEVDRMSRLVEDLILLAKARRPDFVRPAPTDVGDLTRTVLAKARALAPTRDWQLDEAAEVQGTLDEQRLTQALLQLADNAVKHTDPGATVALGSRLVTGPGGNTLTLWVRDAGDGVPEHARETIFDRFGRAGVRPGDEGFGLGLSIVRAIAEAHRGTVHAEAAHPPHPDGSCFVLTLPLEDPWPTS